MNDRGRSPQHFGQSYAQTLPEQSHRFQRAWPSVNRAALQIGRRPVDERFRRRWEYYLSYCEAGFLAGAIDVGLYRITHADAAL